MGRVIIAAFIVAVALISAAAAPEADRAAETVLYNGIRLPAEWPPEPQTWARKKPATPPYLEKPAAVIPIDVGRQLFVDDFLIASSTLQRAWHLPEYHPSPVLTPETPWEHHGNRPFAMVFSDGVWWDPADQAFKMWYLAGPFTCYATSKDGIHWQRPALSVYDQRRETNICRVPAIQRDSSTVWLDLEAKDPTQRYKMSYFRSSLHILYSQDGLIWQSVLEGDKGGDRRGMTTGDRSTVFYNPFRRKWVYSVRAGRNAAGGRCRYYIEADDLAKPPVRIGGKGSIWTCADDLDPPYLGYGVPTQLYNLDATPYESVMLGLFTIWHGDSRDEIDTPKAAEDKRAGRPKINMVKLGYSRDGFHWSRPDRGPFLPVSERRGDWNWGNVQSAGGGCLVVGDRLYFYCSGRAGKGLAGNGDPDAGGSTGLAFLRRDGFASMDADVGAGSLTTRPVRFSGRLLFVNVDAAEGELRAELLDEDGKSIAPFTRENCVPISANATLQPVVWKGADDLAAARNRTVRFRFWLKSGRLYAFWVSADTSGASGGYVAAGGPGFTGPRDTVGRAAYDAARRIVEE